MFHMKFLFYCIIPLFLREKLFTDFSFKERKNTIRIIMSRNPANINKSSKKEEKIENEKLIFTEDEFRDVEHCLLVEYCAITFDP